MKNKGYPLSGLGLTTFLPVERQSHSTIVAHFIDFTFYIILFLPKKFKGKFQIFCQNASDCFKAVKSQDGPQPFSRRRLRDSTSLMFSREKAQEKFLDFENFHLLCKLFGNIFCIRADTIRPYTIFSGFTAASNSSVVSSPNSTAASRRVLPSLWAFLAIFAAFS